MGEGEVGHHGSCDALRTVTVAVERGKVVDAEVDGGALGQRMRGLRRRYGLVDHRDLFGERLVLGAHASESLSEKVRLFLLALGSTMQFGELCLELHRVLFLAFAKTPLGIAVLLLATRNLTKALGIVHVVVGFGGWSHDQWHEGLWRGRGEWRREQLLWTKQGVKMLTSTDKAVCYTTVL